MKLFVNKNGGFTLIELLIVMVILGLLATLVGPALFSNIGKGQRATAATQMDSLATALDLYRSDLGRYPRELEGLVKNDTGRDVWAGPYLLRADAIPKDPWGNDYVYTPGDKDFDLLSYGADGAPGGDGDDADVEL